MKPTPFNLETYAKWHGAAVKSDRPLIDKLTTFRATMMQDALPDLDILYQVLVYMFTYAQNEFTRSRGHEATYQTPLAEALPTPRSATPSAEYETLFKSVPSIVNKMWCKAESKPTVTLVNLRQSLTDLIRTDVQTETLEGVQFLAQRLNDLPGLLYNHDVRNLYAGHIESVAFEPEMKMAAGYFAYHGLVRFKSGYVAEVQIYSALMAEWRRLSHQLYERVRLEPTAKHEFASPESRLISLGHALHLAECEIMRLRQELDPK